ncbi:MAG: vanadium-dependent haloperoxidase [Alcanivoracaceae bacterium]|nr:vanadium-dependent haloperoxidase [Alcanivoracaceae bacterium]
MKIKYLLFLILSTFFFESAIATVAREWNEELLDAIRSDKARPTVHARNLYHVSAAMWDAWASYDASSDGVFYLENHQATDVEASRNETISYAVFRVLNQRFAHSVSAESTLQSFHDKMIELGYDVNISSTSGESPAAIGNAIAELIISMGLEDGSNEENQYVNTYYNPINLPLVPNLPGNPDITDPNRWQPLALDYFIGQSGVILGEYPEFLGPEWGHVTPFALTTQDMTTYQRNGNTYQVFVDPGSPPLLGENSADYKAGFEQVIEFSSFMDPSDGVMIDISPASYGDNDLGTNNGNGHDVNPITGLPYTPQLVHAGDYYRVLAEFWADGPDSETPPGHWFTLLNYVSDHPAFVKRLQGTGPVLDDLQWDVKSYLAMGGAMHDSAVAAWSVKGWYDYIRPISAIRNLCDYGQSSDENLPSYHPQGINLHEGYIQLVNAETTQVQGIHQHLINDIDKIAVKAWKGPDYIVDPLQDTAGVDWILCENWWPYQRPSFVTPPFAGYVSGHSTFSRAAAEVMTLITGDRYFPGGMGVFDAPANDFLVFEQGPSEDVVLQWATYQDAADECSLSRIYGGIHPTADDIPGRFMGYQIGHQSFNKVLKYFKGSLSENLHPYPETDDYWQGIIRCHRGEINLVPYRNCNAY